MVDEINKIELEHLGYDDFFESEWQSLALPQCIVARVVAEHKEAYKVKTAKKEYLAKITGKQIFDATKREDYPAVGDWVAIAEADEERAIIYKILPRRTILKKKYSNKQDTQIIATNIDVAFIVESVDRDYNLNRFERYLVLASEGKIKSTIVLNKIDLISKDELDLKIDQIRERFSDVDIIVASTVAEQGLDELMNYIKGGKTYCFLGSSGVGKSSLINKLLKKDEIETREIGQSTGRGRHTTTVREMYFLENGGIVIDNPGTREVGVADAGDGIENIFNEITALSEECKYVDCTHMQEPGCAVLKAVESGELDDAKYQNYIRLRKENEYYGMSNLDRKQKDRKFGQFVKKALDQLKDLES
ncbi:MAG: hypothetical protein UW46_C0005G0035 [Candidatus Yanofskybacteria bacterium GW2011_GWF1_44_227]|uniref:Small ribosomal subunit biogenesis GTPase RsgA n=1 Tax=Candidatus Yanofskybacteria bacterium GW2011_GWE2_40_11 TaxID=1619033 RepID=A0A0G0QLI5_9BACT|nr:MAG: hypothetical protein UT69_C0010G0007 [Candidatus Yanofskybacteria bacterium GW2011_GWE1_40_10]KKR40998.1 MAG: hypothetical protein UT75_C0002G0035 [Candidatus Yanofskybacteria bacterium GW2011_GWE2_40_11]KKT15521.1 MAG: hypothetical protein UV97_C0005G0014 [Candidatus Yanofskybacteria bacterium GW2011_GWF2_43_596]KKT53229.1 MAG: hypothetical protein UW46_C0005G0035 [Candidatus Yanofskybacteria bacterium GW2011_GWF1_44_227]